MSKPKAPKKSIINSLLRREKAVSDEETDLVNTLEEISRQVHKEAAEQHIVKADFEKIILSGKAAKSEKSPKKAPDPAHNKAATKVKNAKAAKKSRLTTDQYEHIIEDDLTVLDIISRIIDHNSAITLQMIKAQCE